MIRFMKVSGNMEFMKDLEGKLSKVPLYTEVHFLEDEKKERALSHGPTATPTKVSSRMINLMVKENMSGLTTVFTKASF